MYVHLIYKRQFYMLIYKSAKARFHFSLMDRQKYGYQTFSSPTYILFSFGR